MPWVAGQVLPLVGLVARPSVAKAVPVRVVVGRAIVNTVAPVVVGVAVAMPNVPGVLVLPQD